MVHMTQDVLHPTSFWTAAQLVAWFGDVPLSRVRLDREPGTATEDDVIQLRDREDRLYELADGVLLEKAVGNYESYLAGVLLSRITVYLDAYPIGIVLPPDGMLRLAPGLVRIPDVSFISWERLPGRSLPEDLIWGLAPDLAVEVISAGNTREEMDRKLCDYFQAGVRRVWYIYPRSHEVRVYVSIDRVVTMRSNQSLEGADVLPGFLLDLRTFFTLPGPSSKSIRGID